MNQPDRASRNALVPYLDLFARLDDAELARIAGVQPQIVAGLRSQVDAVKKAFAGREKLLPILRDSELARMLGADVRTVQFWRLTCLPPAQQQQPARLAEESQVEMRTDAVIGEQDAAYFDHAGTVYSPDELAEESAPLQVDTAAESGEKEFDEELLAGDDEAVFSDWSDL